MGACIGFHLDGQIGPLLRRRRSSDPDRLSAFTTLVGSRLPQAVRPLVAPGPRSSTAHAVPPCCLVISTTLLERCLHVATHVASTLPARCERVDCTLPARCENLASPLPAFCQHVPRARPARCEHGASTSAGPRAHVARTLVTRLWYVTSPLSTKTLRAGADETVVSNAFPEQTSNVT